MCVILIVCVCVCFSALGQWSCVIYLGLLLKRKVRMKRHLNISVVLNLKRTWTS